jgi:hypothetical protein
MEPIAHTSMGTGAIKYALKPDISSQDLIRSRGTTIEQITGMLVKERSRATSIVSESLGEQAVIAYVNQGLFDAFIDLVLAGFSEYLSQHSPRSTDHRFYCSIFR